MQLNFFRTSFEAKIQLAYLLGVIDYDDYDLLNIVCEIRNKFAHKVNVSFLSEHIQPYITNLYEAWMKRHKSTIDSKDESEWWKQIGLHLHNINANVVATLTIHFPLLSIK